MVSKTDELLWNITSLYHRLTRLSDQLHAGTEVSTAVRSILLLIDREGPMTLPEIASHRGVSRQFIQKITAPLLDSALLVLMPNPRHRRSAKLALGERGAAQVADIRQREAASAAQIGKSLSDPEIDAFSRALRLLNEELSKMLKAEKS